MNPYKTLGVEKSATAEEIKRAYRRKAKQHHPDAGGEGFAEIGKAYALLNDAEARARYDETGATDAPPAAMSILVAMFRAAIERTPWEENIVRAVREALIGGRAGLVEKIGDLESELLRLGKFSGRVTTKSGPNIFEDILEQKTDATKRQLAHLKAEMRRGDEALELLADFSDSFTPEASTQSPAYCAGFKVFFR